MNLAWPFLEVVQSSVLPQLLPQNVRLRPTNDSDHHRAFGYPEPVRVT
jgi:hypothetical protein